MHSWSDFVVSVEMENSDKHSHETAFSQEQPQPNSTDGSAESYEQDSQCIKSNASQETKESISSLQSPPTCSKTTTEQDEPLDFSSHNLVLKNSFNTRAIDNSEGCSGGSDNFQSPVNIADKHENACARSLVDSDFQVDYDATDANDIDLHSEEADEIVQKLCKNGKLMQFHEDDDYIKVIVYEDSQDNDDEDAMTADKKDEKNEGSCQNKTGETFQHKNLLNCLSQSNCNVELSNNLPEKYDPTKAQQNSLSNNEEPKLDDPYSMSHTSQQWYDGMFGPPPGVANNTPNIAPLIASTTTCFSSSASHFSTPFAQRNGDMPIYASQSGTENKMYYTPHPQGGYMFYPEETSNHTAGGSSCLKPSRATSTPVLKGGYQRPSRLNVQGTTRPQLRLNSSGEESVSPMEVTTMQTPRMNTHAQEPMLIPLNQFEDGSNVREQHNQKERRRRARIKEACSLLRQLVPGMSEKTDKATVFEFAARYVHFLKSHTGTKFDKDFLMKYSPY